MIDITTCHGVQDSVLMCCYDVSFNEIVSFKVKVVVICVAGEI